MKAGVVRRDVSPGLQILVAMAIAGAALAAPRTAAASPPAVASVASSNPAAKVEVGGDGWSGEDGTRREWYRGSLALAYGAPVTLLAAGYAAESGEVAGVGGLGLLAPLVVHCGHGNVARGFASVGGTLGMGFLGLFVGLKIAPPTMCLSGLFSENPDDEPQSDCQSSDGGMFVGLLAGITVWAIIDVAFLAYEDVPIDPGVSFSPWISPVVGSAPGIDGDGQSSSITGMQIGALGTF